MRKAFLGNGFLCLGFDKDLNLREMFWPRVGLLNHIQEGRTFGLHLWTPGRLLRIGGEGWDTTGAFVPGMSFRWELRSEEYGLRLAVTDVVDPHLPVWARTIDVAHDGHPVDVGVVAIQSFAMDENTVGECAAWDMKAGRLYHFKGRTWAAIQMRSGDASRALSGTRAVVAKVRDGGVRVDLADGRLSGPSVDHGLIESAISTNRLGAGSFPVEYLLSLGHDREEADRNLDDAVSAPAVESRSAAAWASVTPESLPSVIVLASHADHGGGIVAASDSDIQGDYRDHYRYVWPRDAAMCASSALRASLPEFARAYLQFCKESVDPRGFFWQRYRVDGSRGSGWHRWDLPGGDLPIQEDETALSVIAAGEYLSTTHDAGMALEAYESFVRRAAVFIGSYTLSDGRLVRPSYDLWEERRGVFSFTQAACVGALAWASYTASRLGRHEDRDRFTLAAEMLLRGLLDVLSTHEDGFSRGLMFDGSDVDEKDWTPDGSLFMIPNLLGDLPLDKELRVPLQEVMSRSATTWHRQRHSLAVTLPAQKTPGFARYKDDWYCRPKDAEDRPGNVWPVVTAWYVKAGIRIGCLGTAELQEYLAWFSSVADEAGLLPEQIDCVTGETRSVSPLVWSHAMYLDLLSEANGANTHPGGGTE